jgi:hypothetical protein
MIDTRLMFSQKRYNTFLRRVVDGMVIAPKPKYHALKSDKQKRLESQGCCCFRGQEALDSHEIDPLKTCNCRRSLALVETHND